MPEVNPFENSEQAYAQIVTPVSLPKPRWSVWGVKPWNPTCGLISLEKGAKWFLRLYMYLFIFVMALIVFVLVLAGFVATTSHDDIDILKRLNHTIGNYSDPDLITELAKYENRFMHGQVIMLFCSLAWFSLAVYSCHRCRQALEQGTVTQMKRHFWVVFFFVVMDVLGTFVMDRDTLFILFLEVPLLLFSIFGIMFVYNYILERIQSAGGTFGYSRDSTLESV